MKKFFIKLCWFLAPFLIIAYPLDYFLSLQLSKGHDYPGEFEVWNDIYNKKINSEIAIYGSSRAWVQFNTKIVEDSSGLSCYNFGIDGHNFYMQYLRHLEYIKHNRKPKYIILSADFFSLQRRKDLYQPDQFLPYMLWNKNMAFYTKDYIKYGFADFYLPLIRFGGQQNANKSIIISILRSKKQEPFRYKGYKGMEKTWNNDLEDAKKKNKQVQVIYHEPTIHLLKKFLTDCKQDSIRVAIVYAPEHKEGQAYVKDRDILIQHFKDIAEEAKIPFLDYSMDTLCNSKNYFYNASHLNKLGSDIFTRTLIKDLKQQNFLK
jgi:hypothetical protein